jgi:hypothetical protein
MFFQKIQKSLPIMLSGLAQPTACGLMNQIMAIGKQYFRKLKSVVDVALSDEIPGADDRGPAFPEIFRAGQFVQNLARFVGEISADDYYNNLVKEVQRERRGK